MVKMADVKAGKLDASWKPRAGSPGVPREIFEALATRLMTGILLDMSAGLLSVSDEWNRLLPDYEFTPADVFLTEAWLGKP